MTESKTEAVICIIDDDRAVRESLAAVVETLGCQVDCFPSAEEFLESERVAAADFLIVDVRLAGMGGLELLEQLAAGKHTPPSVVMTGHADVEELELNFWPNKVCVLTKPCHPDRLLGVIARSLPT